MSQVVYASCQDCHTALVTVEQATQISGYSKPHVYRLLYAGKLRTERLGKTWLIYRDSLIAYKNRPRVVYGRGKKVAFPVSGNSRYVPVSTFYSLELTT